MAAYVISPGGAHVVSPGGARVIPRVVQTGTLECELIFRWPAEMQICRGPEWIPPVVDTVPFNKQDTCSWTEAAGLAAGAYYYAVMPLSDTGEDGTLVGIAGTITILEPPAPPTNLHYVSGNAAATVIGWTPSATAGAIYEVFTAAEGAAFDLNAPDQTLPADSSTATLAAFAGYPGKRNVLVRAAN